MDNVVMMLTDVENLATSIPKVLLPVGQDAVSLQPYK